MPSSAWIEQYRWWATAPAGYAVPFLAIPPPAEGGGLPVPYAWDAACSSCGRLLARFEFERPQFLDGAWRPIATYRRTIIPPELSQLEGLDRELKLPRFGLRARARTGRAQPSRRHLSRHQWQPVLGRAVAYCPSRDHERKHLIQPLPQYGPTPDGDIWPFFVNPVSGEDVLAERNPRSELMMKAHAHRGG